MLDERSTISRKRQCSAVSVSYTHLASRAGFIPKENLEHAFPEFGPYLGACQFTGCSHRSEKGCAVRAALAEGKLSQTRYDSYCAMYDEVKDVKEWQRRG